MWPVDVMIRDRAAAADDNNRTVQCTLLGSSLQPATDLHLGSLLSPRVHMPDFTRRRHVCTGSSGISPWCDCTPGKSNQQTSYIKALSTLFILHLSSMHYYWPIAISIDSNLLAAILMNRTIAKHCNALRWRLTLATDDRDRAEVRESDRME